MAAALAVVAGCAAPARADTFVAGYTTAGCPKSVPVWRIGYRLYWRDTLGTVTSKRPLRRVVERARRFVWDVAGATSCGVRVKIEIWDAGAALWPYSKDLRREPDDSLPVQWSNRYDALFYRFPRGPGVLEASGLNDRGDPRLRVAKFPVDPLGSSFPGEMRDGSDPWELLLMHEWLHMVVNFYTPRWGWPKGDVHGACAHGYRRTRCGVDGRYFYDMLNRNVRESGVRVGMRPDEWAYYGTPRRPRHDVMDMWRRVASEIRTPSRPRTEATGVAPTA